MAITPGTAKKQQHDKACLEMNQTKPTKSVMTPGNVAL